MLTPHLEIERWKAGRLVIGVDEAGRGALAGPVTAAAVVFPAGAVPDGMQDSKKLTADQRRDLVCTIHTCALAWSVAFVDHTRIDTVNILQATFDAMHQAIDDVARALGSECSADLLIDGNRFRPHHLPWTTVIGGDGISPTIAAASILAKTSRDTWMSDLDHQYPEYGFARHKGYATVIHRNAIRKHGACEIHRQTFISGLVNLPESSSDND